MFNMLLTFFEIPHLLFLLFGIIVASIGICIHKKINKPKPQGQVKLNLYNDLKKHLKMQEEISQLRISYNSSRAFLYMFHNGEYFYDGSSIKKTSCVYESVKKGTSYEAQNSQGISLTLNPELIRYLTSEIKFIIVEEMYDCFAKHYLEKRNVYAVAYCPIKVNNQMIGYIGINYCNDNIEAFDKIKNIPKSLDLLKLSADNFSVQLADVKGRK